MEKIKAIIVDDHTLFREGLKALLKRQDVVEIVGEAGDGVEGVKKALDLKPDVVLMDLNLPGISGIEAIKRIMAERPETRILMLTVSEDDEDLFEAVRAGAMGYLLKNVDPDRLVDSVRQVSRGETTVSAPMADRIFAEFRAMSKDRGKGAEQDKKDSLSKREKEILSCISEGLSNKEIGNMLNIAESTVKIHVQNILKKLNLNSRVQAAVFAVEHDLAPHKKTDY